MTSLAQGLKEHFTEEQLEKLRAAQVAVIGCGGLGSNLTFMLVRSGIRRLRLIDPDRVSASNLNRQAFFPPDIGLAKVRALAAHLYTLEPELELDCLELLLTRDNAARSVFGQSSNQTLIVAEAVDDAATKAMLYERIRPRALFYVTASGLAGLAKKEAPIRAKALGDNAVLVGDGVSGIEKGEPVLAPGVMQAAALQADAVLAYILK